MATLLSWIESTLGIENILTIMFGNDYYHFSEDYPEMIGKMLTVEDAMPILVREFTTGWGAAGCPPMYAWSKDSVLVVQEYDGRTGALVIPCKPYDGLLPRYC